MQVAGKREDFQATLLGQGHALLGVLLGAGVVAAAGEVQFPGGLFPAVEAGFGDPIEPLFLGHVAKLPAHQADLMIGGASPTMLLGLMMAHDRFLRVCNERCRPPRPQRLARLLRQQDPLPSPGKGRVRGRRYRFSNVPSGASYDSRRRFAKGPPRFTRQSCGDARSGPLAGLLRRCCAERWSMAKMNLTARQVGLKSFNLLVRN